MFDRDQFIEECRAATADAAADPARKALREVIARAVADPAAVMRGLGEPTRSGVNLLYRSDTLTIVNLIWAPRMSVFPHNHNTWAVLGIYSGREDNIFWRRRPRDAERATEATGGEREIEAAGARSLCVGDVEVLGRDVIHSVLNPIDRMTGAIHVYGTDFVTIPRSEWPAETLREVPLDHAVQARRFAEENDRLRAGAMAG